MDAFQRAAPYWWWWTGIGVGAVVLAGAMWWLWWRLPKRQMRSITLGDPKARADIEDNFRKTIGQALGGVAVLLGAVVAYLQFTQQQNAAHDLLISNQVAKGFEQLASHEAVMRLGGIYALEGVMNTSDQYHQPVLEALSAFVRESTIGMLISGKPSIDTQAAMTVIGRRGPGAAGHVDLRSVRIPAADLFRADMSRTDLRGADLRGANLGGGANLTEANLAGTNLAGALLRANLFRAYLSGANLSGADMIDANLSGAYLSAADLSGADLSGANLVGANLSGADLSGANLSNANLTNTLGLSQAQLDAACGTGVHLPEGLTLDKPCPPRIPPPPHNR